MGHRTVRDGRATPTARSPRRRDISGFRNILQHRCSASRGLEVRCTVQVGYQVANTTTLAWSLVIDALIPGLQSQSQPRRLSRTCLRNLRQRRANFNRANYAASLCRQLEVSDSISPCKAAHRLGASAFDTYYILGEFHPLFGRHINSPFSSRIPLTNLGGSTRCITSLTLAS